MHFGHFPPILSAMPFAWSKNAETVSSGLGGAGSPVCQTLPPPLTSTREIVYTQTNQKFDSVYDYLEKTQVAVLTSERMCAFFCMWCCQYFWSVGDGLCTCGFSVSVSCLLPRFFFSDRFETPEGPKPSIRYANNEASSCALVKVSGKLPHSVAEPWQGCFHATDEHLAGRGQQGRQPAPLF